MRDTFRKVVASIFFTTACGWAQTSTGTIIGTVSDSSGAAIAAAKIVITNTGTNAKLDVVSNEEGSYTAPLLQPGAYSVAVTAQGFKSFEQSVVQLRVQQPPTSRCRRRTSAPNSDAASPVFSTWSTSRAAITSTAARTSS